MMRFSAGEGEPEEGEAGNEIVRFVRGLVKGFPHSPGIIRHWRPDLFEGRVERGRPD
jgi:hypothetical protein